MKTYLLTLFIALIAMSFTYGQGVLGVYEQETIIAPDAYRDSQFDVQITKDEKSSKKIWIHNLIPNRKFYAVINTKGEEVQIYAVPKQVVGDYQINIGCVIYNSDDRDVVIALNNEKNCYGISQADYDQTISVGESVAVKTGRDKNNIGVGKDGVKVGSGSDKTRVNKDGVEVNVNKIMEGIQYVGAKL